jgi:hypothetical protein
MEKAYRTTLRVTYLLDDQYGIYWADDNGGHQDYICTVIGFNNAVRVASGIGYQQVECIVTPCFESEYERQDSLYRNIETKH